MAFAVCIPTLSPPTVRHPFVTVSPLRRARSVCVRSRSRSHSHSRSLPMCCAAPEQTPSESSYLLDDLPDPTLPPPTPPPPPRSSASPPGIVQTTSSLDLRVLFAEFLSTFLFVYLSVTSAGTAASPMADALNNAAVIAAVAAAFMPVSGAHLNPAVTWALLITHRVSSLRAAAFLPVQLMAAAAAAYLARFLGVAVSFAGVPVGATGMQVMRALFAEMVPMFVIVAVLFQTAVATEEEGGVGNKVAALYIGLAVLACAGTFTGVFNPARAFGPALVVGAFVNHWVFWVGPLMGATLAALICEHLFLAPAGNRRPKSWLAALEKRSAELGGRIKNLGVAGIISYGIMNTLYYSVAFTTMMFRAGWSSGVSGLAQAWIVTWSLSQVTKPLRLMLSIAFAPIVDRFLATRKARKQTREPK